MKEKNKVGFSIAALIFAFPAVARAQDLVSIINLLERLVAQLIPVLVGIALIVFIWGIIRYVLSKNAEDQSKAKGVMVWGVIALFVIVAIWGLIGFIARTFGINLNETIKAPTIENL